MKQAYVFLALFYSILRPEIENKRNVLLFSVSLMYVTVKMCEILWNVFPVEFPASGHSKSAKTLRSEHWRVTIKLTVKSDVFGDTLLRFFC